MNAARSLRYEVEGSLDSALFRIPSVEAASTAESRSRCDSTGNSSDMFKASPTDSFFHVTAPAAGGARFDVTVASADHDRDDVTVDCDTNSVSSSSSQQRVKRTLGSHSRDHSPYSNSTHPPYGSPQRTVSSHDVHEPVTSTEQQHNGCLVVDSDAATATTNQNVNGVIGSRDLVPDSTCVLDSSGVVCDTEVIEDSACLTPDSVLQPGADYTHNSKAGGQSAPNFVQQKSDDSYLEAEPTFTLHS